VSDLLQLAVDAHRGAQRWEQISRFRAAGDNNPFPHPGRYATWEPYRQAIETTEGGSPVRSSVSIAIDALTSPSPEPGRKY
jgi:hypothetical protein